MSFINAESGFSAALRLSVLFIECLPELITFHCGLPVEVEMGGMPVSGPRLAAVPLQGRVYVPVRVAYAEGDALVVKQVVCQAQGRKCLVLTAQVIERPDCDVPVGDFDCRCHILCYFQLNILVSFWLSLAARAPKCISSIPVLKHCMEL